MDKSVLTHYITPKIAFFTRIEDLENHLRAFNAKMIIFGGTNVIRDVHGHFYRDNPTMVQWDPRWSDHSFSQFFRMF